MIGIKVCRENTFPGQCSETDPGLNWGSDISDVLLVNEDVAKERGRIEIDSVFSNRITSNVSLASRIYAFPGSFVGINDEGEVNSGMLKSIKMSLKKSGDSFTTNTSMVIERNI